MSDAAFDPAAPLRPPATCAGAGLSVASPSTARPPQRWLRSAVLGIVVFAVVVHGASALSLDFLLKGHRTGSAPALVGTAEIVAIATLIAAPIGISSPST